MIEDNDQCNHFDFPYWKLK